MVAAHAPLDPLAPAVDGTPEVVDAPHLGGVVGIGVLHEKEKVFERRTHVFGPGLGLVEVGDEARTQVEDVTHGGRVADYTLRTRTHVGPSRLRTQ